jgi:hypothetical protein
MPSRRAFILGAAGSMLGTTALMCFNETVSVPWAVWKWLEFYKHESCGKCTPCREGTWWMLRTLGRIEDGYGRPEDLPIMDETGGNILFRAFCALADGAVSPLQSTLKYFRDEYEAHIRDGRVRVDQLAIKHDLKTSKNDKSPGTLSLRGTGLDNLAVAKFVVALRSTGAFSQVDLKSSVGNKTEGEQERSFLVECQY